MIASGSEVSIRALLAPPRTFTREEVLKRPSPVPSSPGVYAWYFDQVPSKVPVEGCHTALGATLLYVGISPKAPSRDGAQQSRQSLRTRIRYHYRGNAAGSTLRLTLGSLLADELEIGSARSGRASDSLSVMGREPCPSGWRCTR